MIEVRLWQVVFFVSVWVGLALMHSLIAGRDRKPLPTSLLARFAAWLAISALPVGGFALMVCWPGLDLPGAVVVLASIGLWTISWKLAPTLPLVGHWVRTVSEREAERAEKGIL